MKSTVQCVLILAALVFGATEHALAEEAGNLEHNPDLFTGDKLDVRAGLKVYKSACIRCHGTGNDGAPRLHDAAAWQNRSFESFSVMEKHAKQGFLGMPPKGRRPALSDRELANAVFYMKDQIDNRLKR